MDQMSAKCLHLVFYPKHLNHAFMQTPDFEGLRRNDKEQYENATNQLEENPEFLNEDLHQMPDHPNTFMNSIKARAVARAAVNDERRQVLNPRDVWGGRLNGLKFFRIMLKDITGKLVQVIFLIQISKQHTL
jgi:hypothetical protein